MKSRVGIEGKERTNIECILISTGKDIEDSMNSFNWKW